MLWYSYFSVHLKDVERDFRWISTYEHMSESILAIDPMSVHLTGVTRNLHSLPTWSLIYLHMPKQSKKTIHTQNSHLQTVFLVLFLLLHTHIHVGCLYLTFCLSFFCIFKSSLNIHQQILKWARILYYKIIISILKPSFFIFLSIVNWMYFMIMYN